MKLTVDLQPYPEPVCLLAALPAGLNICIFRYLVSVPEIPQNFLPYAFVLLVFMPPKT